MVIIKNATTGGRPAEARQVGGPPPRQWTDAGLPAPTADAAQQNIPQKQKEEPTQPPVEEVATQKPANQTETTIEEWFGQLLARSIENRASDIHFEPERERFAMRMRIDGILHELETLDFQYQEMVISRIKVLGQMDITKHRLPQDGGFEFPHKGRVYSIRVSTYPTIYGEAAVLRILDREGMLLELKDLGFDQTQLDVMEMLIHKPYGMILVTGPSGSGKTTLLYSILNVLNTPKNNIITIEDPVEVHMNKIRQAQTNQYQDFNFPTALRSVLRQDPDIVMVGEIRDKETAQISIQAALTGKLIFSTFHTLDVFAVVTRFIEMDIPRSVVAHSIEGVISSRLMRKICPKCNVSYSPTEADIKKLGPKGDEVQQLHRGEGCSHCANTGYYGRIGIFEVVAFDDDIRTAILDSVPSTDLLKLLRNKKIKPLSDAAMEKVRQGITTIDEVVRVTGLPA